MKRIILAAGLALGATAANADTWKCGKSYQDHPCQIGKEQKAPRLPNPEGGTPFNCVL